MKISIKLTLIALAALAAPMLQAMEQPKPLIQAIKEDDVDTVRWYMEVKKVHPHEPIRTIQGQDRKKMGIHADQSPFEIVARSININAPKTLKYLLPLIEDDLTLKAFSLLFALKSESPAKETLWQEAQSRKIITQDNLNIGLAESIRASEPQAIRFFLNKGANRFGKTIMKQTIIDIIKIDLEKARARFKATCHRLMDAPDRLAAAKYKVEADAIKRELKEQASYQSRIDNLTEILRILRTDAADLKTRAALNILNQVREGNLNSSNFKKEALPQELIELITELASIDREAAKKWKQI